MNNLNGYKMTEVGVIPEDWEVVELGSIGTFQKGRGIKKTEVVDSGLNCIRYGQLYTMYGEVTIETVAKITSVTAGNSFRLKKGDILFAGSGEKKEEIGKSTLFFSDEETYAGGDIVILRPYEDYDRFLGYALNSKIAQTQKAMSAQGDAVVHIYSSSLKSLQIPLPPTHQEQHLIATALSDADAWIRSLEALLAKKRLVKAGVMEELLTPGFGWRVVRLKEVLTIRHGKSQKEVIDSNGEYPILASGGIIGKASRFLYDRPSVLIGRKGTIDKPQFMDKPFWSVDTLFYSEIVEDHDPKFIYFIFTQIPWRDYNEASGVPSLNAKTIEGIKICIPPSIEEEIRIAAIISQFDQELQTLTTQLAKVRALKAGMMDDLLTGRVRLV